MLTILLGQKANVVIRWGLLVLLPTDYLLLRNVVLCVVQR